MHAFSTIPNWHTTAEFERTSLISSKFATSIGAPKKNFTFSRRVKACILTKTVWFETRPRSKMRPATKGCWKEEHRRFEDVIEERCERGLACSSEVVSPA